MKFTNWLFGCLKKSVNMAIAVGLILLALAFFSTIAIIVLIGFIIVVLFVLVIDAYMSWDMNRKIRKHNVNSNNS